MAILYADDFAWCSAVADLDKDGWARTGGTPSLQPGRHSPEQYYRTFASGSNTAYSSRITRGIPATQAGIVSWTLRPAAISSGNNSTIRVGDGLVDHLSLRFDNAGFCQVYRGTTATLLGTSDRQVLFANTPTRLEMKFNIDDASGSVELRANGVTVLNLTNTDTRNGGNAYLSLLGFGCHDNSNTDYTMICVQDLTGDNNDFLGDMRYYYRSLNSDVQANWTRSSGAANHEAVGALPYDAANVSSATVGAEDEYGAAAISATPAAIFAQEVLLVHRKSDSGSRTIEAFQRSDGNRSGSSDLAMTEADKVDVFRLERDPATNAAWLKAAADASTVGVKVLT